MWTALIRWGRGSVSFRAQSAAPEQFVNLAQQRGLRLWNLIVSQDTLNGSVAPRDYRELAHCARKTSTRLRIVHKRGLVFPLHRYRKRWGLAVGIAFFLSFLLLSQNFIWTIQFPEYDEKKRGYLEELMEEQGITVGAYLPDLKFDKLQEIILQKSSELSWVAFNMRGTTLCVDLKQKVPNPMPDESEPCNIVARKSGQILSVDCRRGVKTVTPKEVVLAGDLLVSSATIGLDGTTKWVHADGKVMAQTYTDHTISFPLQSEEKVYTGEEQNRYALNLLGIKLPLYIAFRVPEQKDTENTDLPLTLFEKEMPMGLVRQTDRLYRMEQREYTEEQAMAEIQKGFVEFEASELAEATILEHEETTELTGNVLHVTRRYLCEEDIAQKISLNIND